MHAACLWIGTQMQNITNLVWKALEKLNTPNIYFFTLFFVYGTLDLLHNFVWFHSNIYLKIHIIIKIHIKFEVKRHKNVFTFCLKKFLIILPLINVKKQNILNFICNIKIFAYAVCWGFIISVFEFVYPNTNLEYQHCEWVEAFIPINYIN